MTDRDDRPILQALDCGFLDPGLLAAADIRTQERSGLARAVRTACADRKRPKLSHFFDAEFYAGQVPTLGAASPLLHYLDEGAAAGLAPHPLIEPDFIRAQLPGLFEGGLSVPDLIRVIDANLCAPSPYFDPAFYASRLDAPLPPGTSPFRHYATRGFREWAAPNPYLDPLWYALRYGDVAGAEDPEAAGEVDFAAHFARIGDRERRRPGPEFDPDWYASAHKDRDGLEAGPLRDFLCRGLAEGLRPNPVSDILDRATARAEGETLPVDEADLTEESAERTTRAYAALRAQIALVAQRAVSGFVEHDVRPVRGEELGFDVARLALPHHAAPAVSILIPCFNEFEVTYECLLSIQRAEPAVPYEVLLADDASTDARMRRFEAVPNLRTLRRPENGGFLRNCNEAFEAARGAYVLLLNSDAQLATGALDALHAAMEAAPETGAAGPKLLYPNGRLQEAGCTIESDGSTTMIGLFQPPERADFDRPRTVDMCSGAALLVRKASVDGPLFDELYAPAYCEDADLCLRIRAAGQRIAYVPQAVAVHHLSVSTGRQSEGRRVRTALRNQHRLFERWAPLLEEINRVRMVAIYLPQFHPVPENDLWWGRGFTEWANVTAARPSYVGHYQPHLPADLGFYDLRLTEVMGQQYELARRYGIEGFCVYYYNFGGRRILERPMEQLLARPDVPFRFCLCWANENWTKHWDGGSREILLAQTYDEATLRAMARDAARFARDPRAITVRGKPLFAVYRPLLIPEVREAARLVRDEFEKAGLPGVHLAYFESMELVNMGMAPERLGFDAAIEFPPQGIAEKTLDPTPAIKPDWAGHRYDYFATVLNAVARPRPPYPRYPGAFAHWDNTPRQPLQGTSFDGSSPELFQAYLEAKIREARNTLDAQERFVFVNAWNEWAEGAHLEPDRAYGHRWLRAVRAAMLTEKAFAE